MSDIKKPKKMIHNHNSIPGYFDGLEDGCTICRENEIIEASETYYTADKNVMIEEIIKEIRQRVKSNAYTIMNGVDALFLKDSEVLDIITSVSGIADED